MLKKNNMPNAGLEAYMALPKTATEPATFGDRAIRKRSRETHYTQYPKTASPKVEQPDVEGQDGHEIHDVHRLQSVRPQPFETRPLFFGLRVPALFWHYSHEHNS